MGLFDSIRKEVRSMKYNRQLANDPAVVRRQLADERKRVSNENVRVKERLSLERDKQELRRLKFNNSAGGRIVNGLSKIKVESNNNKSGGGFFDNSGFGGSFGKSEVGEVRLGSGRRRKGNGLF